MEKLISVFLSLCFACMVGNGEAPAQTTPETTANQATSVQAYENATVYPKKIADFVSTTGVEDAPAIIYTTPADQNRKANTLYKFTGIIENHYLKGYAGTNQYGYFILNTNNGEIAITDPLDILLASGAADIGITENDISKYCEMPKVGEIVCIYAEYQGFSEVLKTPVAFYGGTNYLQKTLEEVVRDKITTNTPTQTTPTKPTTPTDTNKKPTTPSKPTQETKPSPSVPDRVWVTRTGKRYHYSSTCGGKNSYTASYEDAISRGLTPCSKCAR